MDPQRFQLVKRLFGEALEQSPEQRLSWLGEACGADSVLFREVTDLLQGPDMGSTAFARKIKPQSPASEDLSGVLLGAWRLNRALGQGGMGTVWLAARDDQVFEMNAAVKLVSKEHSHPALIGRFRRERQILAHLKHPHIAGLIDGGTTTDGRPYLVMEYVDGETLDVWTQQQGVTLVERLVLAIRLTAAVAYAHGKGIVHRDIKCSNVMVTASGHVKLMDFGIARLIMGVSPINLHITSTGEVLMTPEYAAPELLRGAEATPQSDIYALGLLLLQLFTGVRPRDVSYLLPRSDATRQRPAALPAAIGGEPLVQELAAIFRQALALDPAERFLSALAMGDALVEHMAQYRQPAGRPHPLVSLNQPQPSLDQEPTLSVEDGKVFGALRRQAIAWREADFSPELLPPGMSLERMQTLLEQMNYKGFVLEQRFLEAGVAWQKRALQSGLNKEKAGWAKARRLLAILAGMIVLLLSGFWFGRNGGRRAEADSTHELTRALDEMVLERQFLLPGEKSGGALFEGKLREMASGLDETSRNHMLLTLAQLYQLEGDETQAIGLYPQVITFFRQNKDAALLSRSLDAMAWAALGQENIAGAREYATEALALSRELADPLGVACRMRTLAQVCFQGRVGQEAGPLFEEAIVRFVSLEQPLPAADCMNRLGLLRCSQGRWEDAAKLLEQAIGLRALQLGERHLQVAATWAQLAAVRQLMTQGEQAQAAREQLSGLPLSSLPVLTGSLCQHAAMLAEQSADAVAAALLAEALRLQQQFRGEQHPDTVKIQLLLKNLQPLSESPKVRL